MHCRSAGETTRREITACVLPSLNTVATTYGQDNRSYSSDNGARCSVLVLWELRM